ncbi:anaerobic ribonucleoside-triphosphate reductase [Echinicola jeungdonensis]|uniref:Anaerobic ribonucleoside-triphosphate reductase n=1 Tax=Echinicola jeungdonensis TaxID=709343 RepID=A0ABV5J5K7_9BACT|nr:anaerobic ribonucleoside-triphosphate reductase [Echinicola jeungdonensis]MDN3670676.1 anaerobic ribonucleoside-triphosphate reductase [Echinicola jeungdonensis]
MQKILNTNLLEKHTEKRTKCLVYTRVMGYYRPVESFNIGKKGEHEQRVHFTEECHKANL